MVKAETDFAIIVSLIPQSPSGAIWQLFPAPICAKILEEIYLILSSPVNFFAFMVSYYHLNVFLLSCLACE